VGGNNSKKDRCEVNAVPWPTQLPSVNPGDVPGKVKLISDEACQLNFQWAQNTRSAHFLSTHAREPDGCRIVNQNMIEGARNDLDVLIVQAQSAELAKTDCQPTSTQVSNLDILLNFAPAVTKKSLFATWAEYDTGNEICTFGYLQCTQDVLAQESAHALEILPVGQSFRYIADNSCTADACGYDSNSCLDSLWSIGGLFVDKIHQSETIGSWLAALVIYGGMQTPACLPSADMLTPSGLSTVVKMELAEAAAFSLDEQYGPGLAACSMATQPPTEAPSTVTKYICKKDEPDASMCDEALEFQSGDCKKGGKQWWELQCPTTSGDSPTPSPEPLTTPAPTVDCSATGLGLTGESCNKNGSGAEWTLRLSKFWAAVLAIIRKSLRLP
jgi:hypothetical protein